jgi:hypothetical protein
MGEDFWDDTWKQAFKEYEESGAMAEDMKGIAEMKANHSEFLIGQTVKIIGEVCTGETGELVAFDDHATEGDFYGVYLDSLDSTLYFNAEELRVITPAPLQQTIELEAYGEDVPPVTMPYCEFE